MIKALAQAPPNPPFNARTAIPGEHSVSGRETPIRSTPPPKVGVSFLNSAYPFVRRC
jgi:hypothetical protein